MPPVAPSGGVGYRIVCDAAYIIFQMMFCYLLLSLDCASQNVSDETDAQNAQSSLIKSVHKRLIERERNRAVTNAGRPAGRSPQGPAWKASQRAPEAPRRGPRQGCQGRHPARGPHTSERCFSGLKHFSEMWMHCYKALHKYRFIKAVKKFSLITFY